MFEHHAYFGQALRDTGDDNELQTDVMRFMAILAFCLVAIFAIVQSMPMAPTVTTASPTLPATPVLPPTPVFEVRPVPVASVTVEPEPVAPAMEPAAVQSAPASERPLRPVIVPAMAAKSEPVVLRSIPKPTPPPVEEINLKPLPRAAASLPKTPEPTPLTAATPVTATTPSERGIALRFDSDTALRQLVAGHTVQLYAIEGRQFARMQVSGNDVAFEPTSAPARYHEMVSETVPPEIRAAYAGRAGVWGVALPNSTTQQLLRLVRTEFSGTVVITTDGSLRLDERR